MLLNRFLILLGGSFLAASAAWADDVGFVDCSNHTDETQVFAKARKSPEVISSLPCGERFTILVYGFVFSRIQTKDGNVGYIYSNVISVDRAAASVQRSASPQMSEAKLKVPIPNAPRQPQPTPARPAPAQAPASTVATSNASETTADVAQPAPTASIQPQPAPVQPPTPPSPGATSNSTETAEIVVHSTPPAPAAQPVRNAPARPDPAPAEPPPPSIRPADTRTSWEKPLPSVRTAPLIELFGGFAFARLGANAGGSSSNLIGALGSFGWNLKPWLQIVGDSSYSTVTYGGTKNVLYGNHYGPRYFHRSRNRWGVTPFAEGLIGASRSDSTVTGPGGYTTSVNGLSYKVGGGIDIHPTRRLDIRLFDVDYYRTSFGANLHQTNYWASTGIILRLFGGGSE